MMELEKTINDKIDELEAAMVENGNFVEMPLNHRFLPGLYLREILMPAGTLITSCIHKTIHPYFVMTGDISVYSEAFGEQRIKAPFSGTTIPDTRRVLYAHENTVWTTVHATDIRPRDESQEAIMEAVERIEDEILEKRHNKIVGAFIKNNIVTKIIEPCHLPS